VQWYGYKALKALGWQQKKKKSETERVISKRDAEAMINRIFRRELNGFPLT